MHLSKTKVNEKNAPPRYVPAEIIYEIYAFPGEPIHGWAAREI
jgi:hypothetical protein